MSGALAVAVSLLLLIGVAAFGAAVLAVLDAHRVRRGDMPCVCGHTGRGHEHYRPGSDCGLCDCPAYLPTFGARRGDVARVRALDPPPAAAVTDLDPLYDRELDTDQWHRWDRQVES